MRLLSFYCRVPLAVPYWNEATYRGILRAFLSGNIVKGPDPSHLRSAVMERLGVEDALVCGSGSLALEIALRACGVRANDEVVIPTFCCTSIVPPILAVGALPVLADIGEDLNITAETVEAALTKKTRAVIVPHLFGNPAEIEAIVELVRRKNVRVIDDAAQALGATIDGRPAGSFGDAGILSFGSEKVCFGLGGGMVVSRQKEALNGNLKIDLSAASLSPTLRSFLSTLVWRRWRRWTLPLQIGAGLIVAAESPVGKWNTVEEKSGKVTSQVEVYEQSGKLFGKIVALTEPNDKQGKPKVCIACTDAEKDKPIVGLVILRDLSLSGDRYTGGTVLDPEDGKVYTAEIWVEDGKLMVRGYSGFLYKTRTWLKP